MERTLKIKTGAVKRLRKELQIRHVELQEEEVRVENLKEAGEDEWTVNKQNEVVQQSVAIIPETRSKLAAAVKDLQALIENLPDHQSTELSEAKTAVEEALKEL